MAHRFHSQLLHEDIEEEVAHQEFLYVFLFFLFLTLLFNHGHADQTLEDIFTYDNIASSGQNKIEGHEESDQRD
jgi:hypothetical protein